MSMAEKESLPSHKSTYSPLSKVAVAGLFIFLAIYGHSLSVVVALTSALLIGASMSNFSLRQVLLSNLTWYLPFVALADVVVFSSPSEDKAVSFPVFTSIYVFARVMRALIPVPMLAKGMAMAALLIGIGFHLGQGTFFDTVPVLDELALRIGKNPAGWTIGFGFVGVLIAFGRGVERRGTLIAWGAVTLAILAALILADSVTPVIAIFALAFLIAVIFIMRGISTKTRLPGEKAMAIAAVTSLALLGLALLLQNLTERFRPIGSASIGSGSMGSGSMEVLVRDFSNLTGRNRLWQCYIDAVSSNLEDPWAEAVTCSGWGANHLHNIFLQSHLMGGFPLAITLMVAMAIIGVHALICALRASTSDQLLEAIFTLGLTAIAFVVGLAESFMTYDLLFGTIAIFLAPPPARRFISSRFSRLAPSKKAQRLGQRR